MSKKLMMLAAGALTVLAFAALPSMASAGVWECDDVTTGGACETFTGTNTTTTTLSQDGSSTTVTCTSNEVHGAYTSTTTGTLQILFHGCTSGLECHSPGQPNGTITTEVLTVHNVLLEAGTPGVLLTPGSNGRFATFTCAGFITVHVEGNGLLGDLTRECNEVVGAGESSNLDFETVAAGTQKWTQVTTTGTHYDLSALTTPSTTRTGGQDGEGAIKFADETQITC